MKNIIMTILAVSLFSACSKVGGVNPSQNRVLNSIAGKMEKQKSGFMQQKMDRWLKEDWTPTVERNKEVKKINEDQGRNFTIQEYVDKMEVYSREQNSSSQESHANKINSMPVIGNRK